MTQPSDKQLAQRLVHSYDEYQAALTNGDQRARAIVTQQLATVVEQHGWPTRRLVGDAGAAAAIALAEYASAPQQREWLVRYGEEFQAHI